MKVIKVRNVNDAFIMGLCYLQKEGVKRDSRNGKVLVAPEPVCTVYLQPKERVLFNIARDANPFFHLYESIWMLAGRRDVKSLTNFVARMEEFSDDGTTFHAAYGYRWMKQFKIQDNSLADFVDDTSLDTSDQISKIIDILKNNKDDRRAVLQIWDAHLDLGKQSKDIPCNLTVHFQVSAENKLDMTVFNRSNDIIWGCYGANAVHFSFLQEYVAYKTSYEIGRYYQISNNYHAYLKTLEKVKDEKTISCPYSGPSAPRVVGVDFSTDECLKFIREVRPESMHSNFNFNSVFLREVALPMTVSYYHYKKGDKRLAQDTLLKMIAGVDWKIAGLEWLGRRK
jgi:thymidylate synthase